MTSYTVKVAKGSIGNCRLGEGPHWDPIKKDLLYVDIFEKAIFRYATDTQQCKKVVVAPLDAGPVSLIIPVEGKPDKYVITVGPDLIVMDWDGNSATPTSLKTIHSVDGDQVNVGFNDGKCDTEGRIFAGTMGVEGGKLTPKKGSLYSFDLQGKVKKHFSEVDIANGLCWSPDNSLFYYIDSNTYRVDVFDYDANSETIKNRRTAFDFKANNIEGLPDGMTIDQNGNLYVAMFNGHRVIQIDPKVGKQIGEIVFPTKDITSVAFGGKDLSILYATSSCEFLTKDQLADQPDAGSLFEITNVGAKGLTPGINYKGPI